MKKKLSMHQRSRPQVKTVLNELSEVESSSESDDDFSNSVDSDGYDNRDHIWFYCKHTQYDVIWDVGKVLDFHLTKREKSLWDIAWFDAPVTEKFLRKLKPW